MKTDQEILEELVSLAAGAMPGRYTADPAGGLTIALAYQLEELEEALAMLAIAQRRPYELEAWRNMALPLVGLALGLEVQAATLSAHGGELDMRGPQIDAELGALAAQLADYHRAAWRLHEATAGPMDKGSESAAAHLVLAELHELLHGLHLVTSSRYAGGQLGSANRWAESRIVSNCALASVHNAAAAVTRQLLGLYWLGGDPE